MTLSKEHYTALLDERVFAPHALTEALLNRKRRSVAGEDGNLLIIAADHTARGKLSLGKDVIAMADRFTLLDRLVQCLALPGVDGVLASADILEELAWLGALNHRLAIGTINRGGIIGARWELDDRVTSYDVEHIESSGLDGGKTLIRIDHSDPSVARTLETVASVTTQLADRKIMSLIEPLPYLKDEGGSAVLDPSDEALIKVVAIASGLGASSAYTWLKIPASARMTEVAGATSLPILMLGGEPTGDPSATFDQWTTAMCEPNVRGLTAGRSLLYPLDGDFEGAAARAGTIVHPAKASPPGPAQFQHAARQENTPHGKPGRPVIRGGEMKGHTP
jgi:DhnA family fructose-bisphosphate aldolase class Ia